MKQFLFNTKIGVSLTIIVISMITLAISITLSLSVYGIGKFGLDCLYGQDFNERLVNSSITVWTLLMIVVFILFTIWLWMELMINTNSKYNVTNEQK